MKQLTIRIERRTLCLAETETRGARIDVKSARSFPLPESMENGACADDPEALAEFIADMIKRGRLAPAPVVLLFNSEIARCHEYYHQAVSARETRARVRSEAETILSPDLGTHILENENYNPNRAASAGTSAVIAISDGFLRTLLRSLKKLGVKCRFASSALSARSDLDRSLLNALLKNNVRLGENPICLDVGEDYIRFVFFVDTQLLHRRETPVPEGLSDDELLFFIEEQTKELILHVANREDNAHIKPDCILISGDRVVASDFADRVAGRMNAPCRRWDVYEEQLRGVIGFGGELGDRKGLHVRAFSSAGAIPGKQRAKNLLCGGFRKRLESGMARAAAVFFIAAAIAAMSVMPVASWYIERQNAEALAVVMQPMYAEAREKLAAQKQLNVLLQNHMAEEAYMQSNNLKYGGLLYQISRSILAKANIERVEHENNSNTINITFTTSDLDYFLEAKDATNSGNYLTVEDSVVVNRLESALWRCDITVSWELPAAGGASE
jgi:hypothetical protein